MPLIPWLPLRVLTGRSNDFWGKAMGTLVSSAQSEMFPWSAATRRRFSGPYPKKLLKNSGLLLRFLP